MAPRKTAQKARRGSKVSKAGARAPKRSRKARSGRAAAPAPVPQTEGQRQLLEVADSLAAIATKVGCSKPLAGFWRGGSKSPSSAMRERLEEAYGIPPVAWDLAPGAAVEVEEPEDVEPETDVEGADTLALTNAQLAAIRQALRSKKLSEAARSKKEDTYAKLLALKARLERDQELAEDRIVREHPMWRRIRETVLEAVKPWPEAARAIAQKLQELGA